MSKLPLHKESQSFRARQRMVEEEQRRQRSTSPFSGTGISPDGQGGLSSYNFVAGSSGYAFNGNGNAEFNDLTLRGNLISNDALISPITPAVANTIGTNFSLVAGAWTTVVSVAAIVPDGCTQLLANISGMAFVTNPNSTGGSNGAGGDVIQARVIVGPTNGMTTAVSISGSNGQTSVSAAVAGLLTGLSAGGTVTLKTQAASGFQNFAANGSNQANLTATLLWLR